MAFYKINLVAGKEFRQLTAGSVIVIDSIGVSPGVDVTPVWQDGRTQTIPGRRAGFKYVVDFTEVTFVSPVDCVMQVFLSKNDVDLGWVDGMTVAVSGSVGINNDAAHAVPVSVAGGVINMTATNVGINNTAANPVPVAQQGSITVGNNDAAAIPVRAQALATIVNIAPVTVGTAIVALVYDATLKKLRIRNSSATAIVAIGAAGLTMANAAVQLLPGDVWHEDDAAGAQWYAISDTAGTVVQLQGLK